MTSGHLMTALIGARLAMPDWPVESAVLVPMSRQLAIFSQGAFKGTTEACGIEEPV